MGQRHYPDVGAAKLSGQENWMCLAPTAWRARQGRELLLPLIPFKSLQCKLLLPLLTSKLPPLQIPGHGHGEEAPGSPDHFSHRPDSPAPNHFCCSCLPAANHPSALDHFFPFTRDQLLLPPFAATPCSLYLLHRQALNSHHWGEGSSGEKSCTQQEAAACVKVLQGFPFSRAPILLPVPSQG
jgi:hypothetical protein